MSDSSTGGSERELEPGEVILQEKGITVREQIEGNISIQAEGPGDVIPAGQLVEALTDAGYILQGQNNDESNFEGSEKAVTLDDVFVPDRYYLCLTCGRLKHQSRFERGDCTCLDCYDEVERGYRNDAKVRYREVQDGDGFVLTRQNKSETNLEGSK